jgi:hypothetical protein
MKLPCFAGLVFGLACCVVGAQEQAGMHAPDGGTRERLESLTVLPATNAPFTATVTTEWTTILVDGSKQTIWNHRTIARDSSGRILQERRFFAPNGDKVTTPISEVDYLDQTRHERYVCRPQEKVCYVSEYNVPPSASLVPAGPMPSGRGSVQREELGRKTIEGVDVVGSREITTMNAELLGMRRPRTS